MQEDSYEFDVTTCDQSNDEEDEVTLDNWRPKETYQNIIQSKWRETQTKRRKTQIKTKFNGQPGLDDLKKIVACIKKDIPEHEILRVFGINSKTLMAIKENRYCPVDGITVNMITKIEFKKNVIDILDDISNIEKKINIQQEHHTKDIQELMDYILFIFDGLFLGENWKKSFKIYKSRNKSKKDNNLHKEDTSVDNRQ